MINEVGSGGGPKPKTPLKKEELEAIAKELKKKLSKALITAKSLLPPVKKLPLKLVASSCRHSPMLLLPSLYSPHKLPTKKPLSVYLLLLPLKAEMELPTKRMVLEPALPTRKLKPLMEDHGQLRPTPSLQASALPPMNKPQLPLVTTPKQQRRELVKTPQRNGYDEGADLLMYLATSPSPAKPYTQSVFSNNHPPMPSSQGLVAATSGGNGGGNNLSFGAAIGNTPKAPPRTKGDFIAPAPPMTPKRGAGGIAKTPQNKLTPGLFLALPSQGLTLTPTGFNMSDYVNFFTPSPGGEMLSKNLLKTPDFNNFMNQEKKF